MANALQYETSPYLLQHQHNPVDWQPWGEEALAKAKKENKLLLISVGYSACHWCHVMERESFENKTIAETMNKFYVSVKVDREERPDIDQLYMIAVQLMTNSGGWPLHCICLPDGRPIYGGTYFKPQDWQNVLLQVAQMWEEQPDIALEYAQKLTKGVQESEKLPIKSIPEHYTTADIDLIVQPWKAMFDTDRGGYARAPKFPLPNNWVFLLRYAHLTQDQHTMDHVHHTLIEMASGGIYDQIGGGFARYSVDHQWHIPHFEKMLYDNGQLISLYAEAFQASKNPLYQRVVSETIQWLKEEMLAPNGGFYCALDADSEGVEGKFYSFSLSEFNEILGDDAALFAAYFNCNEVGNWTEENTNIPYLQIDADSQALEAGFTATEWESYLKEIKTKLKDYRNTRIKPALDHKQLATWNALILKGLIDAYRVFDQAEYLTLALQNAQFITEELIQADASILHQPASSLRRIGGFLDDYAFCIEAFIALYEATFDEKWLYKARDLSDYCIAHFYSPETASFYYTSNTSENLIARKSEILDNVIPASCSTITRQLKKLGLLLDNVDYIALADQQFATVFPHIKTYGSAYSNWAIFLLEEVYGSYEIALTGQDCQSWRKELDTYYIPTKITLGGTKSTLPLLLHRQGLESKVYLCKNKTCSLPQDSITALIKIIE